LFPRVVSILFLPAFQNEELTLFCGEVSGVGSVAVQMAKNVYGADKVITTVSTAKVSRVDDLLGKGIVDESELSRPLHSENLAK